jgi:hypothetical protein
MDQAVYPRVARLVNGSRLISDGMQVQILSRGPMELYSSGLRGSPGKRVTPAKPGSEGSNPSGSATLMS